ncbi:hypothetical protein QYF61_018219, partial [Mycteria americana]
MEGRDYPPPLSTHQTTFRILRPVLFPPIQKRLTNWSGFTRGSSRWLGLEHCSAEELDLVPPGKEEIASGGPNSSPQNDPGRSSRRWSQALHSAEWWEDDRQWTSVEKGRFGLDIKKHFFPREDSRAVEQVVQSPSLESNKFNGDADTAKLLAKWRSVGQGQNPKLQVVTQPPAPPATRAAPMAAAPQLALKLQLLGRSFSLRVATRAGDGGEAHPALISASSAVKLIRDAPCPGRSGGEHCKSLHEKDNLSSMFTANKEEKERSSVSTRKEACGKRSDTLELNRLDNEEEEESLQLSCLSSGGLLELWDCQNRSRSLPVQKGHRGEGRDRDRNGVVRLNVNPVVEQTEKCERRCGETVASARVELVLPNHALLQKPVLDAIRQEKVIV